MTVYTAHRLLKAVESIDKLLPGMVNSNRSYVVKQLGILSDTEKAALYEYLYDIKQAAMHLGESILIKESP